MIAAVSDDAEVISSSSTTDPERFTELYHQYAAEIHRYIASRLGRTRPTT